MKVATPVFDGIEENEIHSLLAEAKKKQVNELPRMAG